MTTNLSLQVPAAGPAAVFVDLTGRRGRWITAVGVVLAALLIVYVMAVLASVLGADPVPDGALPPTALSLGHPTAATFVLSVDCASAYCSHR